MVKLTKAERAVLKVARDRPLDVFDLADQVGISPDFVFQLCIGLKRRGLVDWMYAEDEVAPSEAGRKALEQANG